MGRSSRRSAHGQLRKALNSPANLRSIKRRKSNKTIHLAVAIRLGADEIITYDAGLTEAARTAGLSIFAPRR